MIKNQEIHITFTDVQTVYDTITIVKLCESNINYSLIKALKT
jgi:hypothetical protein